jgi:CheY-like chemotaxis protein
MSDPVGPQLLYVEDEPLIREVGSTTLEDAGFKVLAIESGAEAIKILEERGADFKALVTDIDLFKGPDGWLVAKYARELFPQIPVIYVSGGSAGDWPSMGVPGSIMVAKPYASAEFVVAVLSATLNADHR